ncbi:hypothetical protein [Siphonobacter curvatus]|uniref:DUF5672 domain-containing protein n=1 Tax=Siphonobacter curvatus TaxID=2094562 RepID=A0A2S7IEV4_9BACT|nr:hypothetical protein [Siphonobacter curvatus]PQA53176.1 hypothetical protein C5O19_24930 [Siphonobacter curvatus]
MNAIVCTLFEGHYHYGVAALANSLYNRGFRGVLYVGYRGSVPFWAEQAVENPALGWPGSQSFSPSQGLDIHFLPLETTWHLTNYKPEFMLRIFNNYGSGADAILYFDPDIVVKCQWEFYLNWVSYGVALVHEITSNDMPYSHPIRMEWLKLIDRCNLQPQRKLQSYINGGFCGVSRRDLGFLDIWSLILKTGFSYYQFDPSKFMPTNREHPFYGTDQDALNMTAMCSEFPLSEIGPEGMDFVYGGYTMSHAVGSPKPWKKNYIWSALQGNSPSLPDKCFWQNVQGPIATYHSWHIQRKQVGLTIASAIGRFYRRA